MMRRHAKGKLLSYKLDSGSQLPLQMGHYAHAEVCVAVKLSHVIQELGLHPEDGEPVTAAMGTYGPYVRHQKLNASLPKVTLHTAQSEHANDSFTQYSGHSLSPPPALNV